MINGINIGLISNYVIGASIPLIAGFLLFTYRQYYRADQLRSILITDLEHTEPRPEIALERDEVYLYDSVFKENAGKLGLLHEEEIELVIEAYANLRRAREELAIGTVPEDDKTDAKEAIDTALKELKKNRGIWRGYLTTLTLISFN